MTFFDFSKAEIIAFQVGTSEKLKKSFFSIFVVSKELTNLKVTLEAKFCLQYGQEVLTVLIIFQAVSRLPVK